MVAACRLSPKRLANAVLAPRDFKNRAREDSMTQIFGTKTGRQARPAYGGDGARGDEAQDAVYRRRAAAEPIKIGMIWAKTGSDRRSG